MEAARHGGRAPPGREPQLRIHLFGELAASRDGERLARPDLGSRKGRTLLKVLLLQPDEPVSTDRLRELLWPDGAPATAERTLASLVSRLRALLGPETIVGGRGHYRFQPQPHIEVDLHVAERLARQARAHLARDDAAPALLAARRGLELVGSGTLLADEPDVDWVTSARTAVTRLQRELRRAGWEAAFATDDPAGAGLLATAALEADPLDEEAARARMRAHHRGGETAAALQVYERLRAALAEELGVDPAAPTQDLHVALLRDDPASPEPPRTDTPRGAPPTPRPHTGDLVGRDEELGQLQRRWTTAIAGDPALVLVVGEAGIGKTRLVEELLPAVTDTGGAVLAAHCYGAERSLFLGPIVDVLATLAHRASPDRLAAMIEPWGGTLAQLVPELDALLGPFHYETGTPEVERRRAFEAVTSTLTRLADDRAFVLFLDDLHNAGAATLEFLHYLMRHLRGSPVLVVGTCRVEEGAVVQHELGDVADTLELGPLPEPAVEALVREAGADRFGRHILASTRGHTLSVVEMLHALADMDPEADPELAAAPVPDTLQVAVLQRLERAGAEVEELLRGAATLGNTFEVVVLSGLLELPVAETVRRCERAVRARLLVEHGERFAFPNELVQQIVYETTPRPIQIARHRRATELLADNPEAVANHANAADDHPLALSAFLEAASRAAQRYANRDAEELLGHAVASAEASDDPEGVAHARLDRAIVREALTDYAGALADLEAARELARTSGRADLEAHALRQLGGDVLVGLGRPTTDCLPYLETGLEVAWAAQLGQPEVDLEGRIAVIWTNRARFDRAAEAAEHALARARELDDPPALALALDAVKNVSAYTGDLSRLEAVIPELRQLLEDAEDPYLRRYLPWTLFEAGLAPFAHAEWDRAEASFGEAIELTQRSGHAWVSLFLAHRSWLHRQCGDLGRALIHARAAAEEELSAGHPWWQAFAATTLGWLLADIGEPAEAVTVLEAGRQAAERDGVETYLVRCVSHLALARWRAGQHELAVADADRADELLDGVRAPPGRAFLHGGHAYTAVARVRLANGELERARHLLDQLRGPAEAVGWRELVVTDRILRGRAHLLEGDFSSAKQRLAEGLTLAERAGLIPLAWEAHAALASIAEHAGDVASQQDHAGAGARYLEAMASSLDDEDRGNRLRREVVHRMTEPSGEPAA